MVEEFETLLKKRQEAIASATNPEQAPPAPPSTNVSSRPGLGTRKS
jgi:hypothetical protein